MKKSKTTAVDSARMSDLSVSAPAISEPETESTVDESMTAASVAQRRSDKKNGRTGNETNEETTTITTTAESTSTVTPQVAREQTRRPETRPGAVAVAGINASNTGDDTVSYAETAASTVLPVASVREVTHAELVDDTTQAQVISTAATGPSGGETIEEEDFSSKTCRPWFYVGLVIVLLVVVVGIAVGVTYAVTESGSSGNEGSSSSAPSPVPTISPDFATADPSAKPSVVPTQYQSTLPPSVPPTTVPTTAGGGPLTTPPNPPSPPNSPGVTVLCSNRTYTQDLVVEDLNELASLFPLSTLRIRSFELIIQSLTNRYDPVTGGGFGTGELAANTTCSIVDSFPFQNVNNASGVVFEYELNFCSNQVDPEVEGYHPAYISLMSNSIERQSVLFSIQDELGISSAVALSIPMEVGAQPTTSSPTSSPLFPDVCADEQYLQQLQVQDIQDLEPLTSFQLFSFERILESLTNQYDPVELAGGVGADTACQVVSADVVQEDQKYVHDLTYNLRFCSVDPSDYHPAFRAFMELMETRANLVIQIQEEMGLSSAVGISPPELL